MFTTTLTKEIIDAFFDKEDKAEKPHQSNVIMSLYKYVIPIKWDKIERLNGYPICNETMTNYLFKKFMTFDRKHHPDVVSGGAWMNNGFGTDKTLQDDIVIVDEAIIIYKQEG